MTTGRRASPASAFILAGAEQRLLEPACLDPRLADRLDRGDAERGREKDALVLDRLGRIGRREGEPAAFAIGRAAQQQRLRSGRGLLARLRFLRLSLVRCW